MYDCATETILTQGMCGANCSPFTYKRLLLHATEGPWIPEWYSASQGSAAKVLGNPTLV
jgi:hypothetical protein